MRVGLLSLGCAKNLADAEIMLGRLLQDGVEVTNDASRADVVILKDGRIVSHDSVANLRSTLQLPSLDAVFAALVHEENVDERTRGLLAAMKPSMGP